ncbi:MAG: SUMF1/EgtB/PvdO family nonheme iron enzyme [Armatimonadetes bacterium]|nr:SUMF1/EgtB/PvdO family nonheme iron enzyme [Armatimonadota bacterium]
MRRWRARLRWWWRRRRRVSLAGRAGLAAAQRLAQPTAPTTDPLSEALLRLRRVIDEQRLSDLALAWYRVDEAKAAAVGYSLATAPAYPPMLPEEQALAERLWRQTTGRGADLAELSAPVDDPLPMVRYRLLVALLPSAVAAGGATARGAIGAAYPLLHQAPDMLSPYGRWLLAQAVCRAARDREESARQAERFRLVTTDQRAADGSIMVFVSGGEFRLPVPMPLTRLLDLPGMPTRRDSFKRDAPPEIARIFLGLTPRGRQIFLRAFARREEAYLNGRPWLKPPNLTSEGTVFCLARAVVPAFFIDREPISNERFAEFTRTHPLWRPSRVSRHAVDRDTYLPHWSADQPPRAMRQSPITGVSYQSARAYVAGCGKHLPTEAQWLLAMVGAEVPETRQLAADSRPTMTAEERTLYATRAAERGIELTLPERLYDFDGCCPLLPYDPERVLYDPRGPASGAGHLWRTPTARGRVPDPAGDANLTFRGVLAASTVWTAGRD